MKYINRKTRENIAMLSHAHGAIEKVEKLFQEHTDFDLKYLRMAGSFLYKFVNEEVLSDPAMDNDNLKRLYRYIEKTALVLERRSSFEYKLDRWEKTRSNKTVEVSTDYLEDLIVFACNGSCIGCSGKDPCDLREMLIKYDVPATTNNPENCQFELLAKKEVSDE